MSNIALSPNKLSKRKHVLQRLDSNLNYLVILCKTFSIPTSEAPVPAFLNLVIEPSVPIEDEAMWAPVFAWTL